MNSSRRSFLAAGLALPAAGLATTQSAGRSGSDQPAPVAAPASLSYQKLGRTGLTPTRVAFGCMITSDGSVIEKAADLGINYFDTARVYQGGNNERMVGAALKAHRKQVYISSKTGANDKAGALEHIDTTLKTLGTDYIDIWYLHGKDSGDAITDDLLEAQSIAKKDGKIRFAGVSTHKGQASVIDGAIKSGKIDVVLVAYNFTMGPDLEAAIGRAKAAGLGVVAMKVMAGGFRKAQPGEKLYETLKRDGAMVAALKWVLKNPNVDTTIPSITDMDQLDANLKVMTSKFSDDDQKILGAHLQRIGPLYCRMCGHCEGTCSQGLPVADVLRFLTYADGYGQFALGRERFLELPAKAAAVRCRDCSSCSVDCPHGVRVPERLSRAQELFA
ncbi:MAG: aldo/keto reductase [Bryobacteraceae bacterium]